MTREALLKELHNDTYVMIRPSPIEGIGVFAIRNIPKGCRAMFSTTINGDDKWIEISKAEVEALPDHTKVLVENYCLYDDQHYYVPEYGFKKMDLVNFLNHSNTPNIVSINDGDYFEALRDIVSGEELLVDYGELVEDNG